jgi:hypothetical protein
MVASYSNGKRSDVRRVERLPGTLTALIGRIVWLEMRG